MWIAVAIAVMLLLILTVKLSAAFLFEHAFTKRQKQMALELRKATHNKARHRARDAKKTKPPKLNTTHANQYRSN